MASEKHSTYSLFPNLYQLPQGWCYQLLSALVDEARGISYGIVQPGKAVPSGIPIVRVNNIRDGRITTADMLRVDSTIEAQYQRTRLRGREVLLTLVGTLGETATVQPELIGWNVARAVAVIPVRPEIGAEWVQYCLRSAQAQHLMRTWATTTVQATLNLRDVANLPIPIPPTSERNAIAHILGTLDDKIDLNRHTNETLEAMARALFKSWFVDFDPVRAKAEGRQPVGMDAETAALFPDGFEESELGQIPDSWRREQISDVFQISRVSLTPTDYPQEMFDHYSIPAYDEGQKPFVEAGDTIKSQKFLVPPRCVLVSKLNPHIPRVWLPSVSASRRSICSTEFLVALATTQTSTEYVYGLLTSERFIEVFQTLVTGTSNSHQRVRAEDLLTTDTILPDSRVIVAFSTIVQPMFQKMQHNLVESNQLTAIRDTLLPKLLSGEIRVKEAEKLVEMHV